MPTVPTLHNQVGLNALPNVQRRPLQSTGLQAIGEGLQNVSGVIQQVQKQEQLKADRAAFMEADRTTDTIANDLYSKASQKQLKDAIGITPQSIEEFDKRTSEVMGSLQTDRQKMTYREAVNQRRSQLQRSIESHENSQRETYYAKSREDYKDQAHVNAVTNYQDPKAIESEIDKVRATVDQTPGIDADQKAAEVGIRRSGIYSGVIDRYLSNDQVSQADAYYKSIKDKVNGPQASNIERALITAKQRLESEKKAKLTEMRQSLGDQLQDIHAAAQMGVPVTQVPPRAVLEAVFGKYEGGQKYETAQKMADLSVEVNALHDLSAEDLYQQTTQYKPVKVEGAAEAAQITQFMSGRVQQILQERDKDPAGYLVRHSPAVAQAWDNFEQSGDEASRAAYLKTVRAERERLQIPGDDILPDTYAQGVADRLNTADAQKLATLIEREAQTWGADWPAVQGQLAGKISDTAAVISSGIPRGAAVQLAATANLKENELKALLPPGTTWPAVEAAVDQTFESFKSSLPIEAAQTWNAFRDSGTRLAVQYMHQGMSQSNAIDKAYKDLVRDQIVEFRAAPFRVPPTENKEQIETGARQAVQEFVTPPGTVIPSGAFTAEEYQSQLQDYVRENGYWVTRPDAKGLRLYVDGGPLAGVDGPVQYTWEQLRTYGDKGAEASRKRLSDEITRRKEAR